MRKILFFFAIMLSAIICMPVNAQNAKSVLDKTASVLKGAGDVKVGFSISINGNPASGTISISGNKFQCNTGGTTSWFDGKTMWHYVAANDEVNVTNPSASEVARMNPYSFLSLYKSGYKCEMRKSSSSEYEIMLTGEKKGFSNIVVRISKKTNLPTYVKTVSAKSTTEITISSFLKNQQFSASTFTFNKSKYPDAEIVDLR